MLEEVVKVFDGRVLPEAESNGSIFRNIDTYRLQNMRIIVVSGAARRSRGNIHPDLIQAE